MLTIFILPGIENNDAEKLMKSFKVSSLTVKFVMVDTVADINIYKKETLWYGVFYDNEYLEEELAEALFTFFVLAKVDILTVFKLLEESVKFFPRFFKYHIYLKDDLSPLQQGLIHEKILNGWVLENGKRIKSDYDKSILANPYNTCGVTPS